MRILIANPFGIGDVLFSLPLVRALRRSDPGLYLGFLCNRRTEELVRAWPELNACTVFEKDEIRAAWKRSRWTGYQSLQKLLKEIQLQRFNLLLDLSLNWQISLAARWIGIRQRIGYNHRGRGRFLTRSIPLKGFQGKPVAEYYLDLLPLAGIPVPKFPLDDPLPLPDSILRLADEWARKEGLAADRLIAFVPGGGASWGPNAVFKQWPPAHFIEAGRHLLSRWKGGLLLIGDAAESALCGKILAGLPAGSARIVRTDSLLLLAALLKRCCLVLGNDSGPMHLAAFTGTSTVSIFGPVDPLVYGPFHHRSQHRVITQGVECQPCYQAFRFPPCPWDNRCLKELQPSTVIAACDELLEGRPHAASSA